MSKIFGYLLNPTAWVFMALVAAVITKGRWRKRLIVLALVLFYVFSNNFLLKTFLEPWEEQGKTQIDSTYDVGIVLGGWIAEYDEKLDRAVFKKVPDRLLQAYRLYRTGHIDKILISGGSGHYLYPWKKESKVVRNYLLEIGMPEEDILADTTSRNTYENAVYSKKVIEQHPEIDSKLLITSAIHMRRAKACFESVGLEVDIFGADRIVPSENFNNLETIFVPSLNSYYYWHMLIHEWIGYVVYDIRGYIE
ncbi:MAG: YdcF family protein [Bacteroidales bacterium]|nr:YdcF family protein [Bacteroidales bacterium]MCF8333673.1 YdcF family protein [Bacteroidales bacterium]